MRSFFFLIELQSNNFGFVRTKTVSYSCDSNSHQIQFNNKFNLRYLIIQIIKTIEYMTERKKIKVSYGEINEKNINMLRKFNFEVFPVKYSTHFYIKVAMQYTKLSKYCFYNDIIIGSYTVRVQDYKQQKHAYILTFGVLQPYRKFGIGYQMMENLETQVRDKSDAVAIYLHMHVKNQIGKRFYERCGFVIDERLENYYTDLDEPHCYVLRKPIVRQQIKQQAAKELQQNGEDKK